MGMARTTVSELSARYASLEDAFFDLTEGAADYVTDERTQPREAR